MIKPEWFNTFLGFIMPIVVNFLTMRKWRREIKTLIAILISLFIGIISTQVQGFLNLQPKNVFNTFIQIFTISQIAYNLFWKTIFIREEVK